MGRPSIRELPQSWKRLENSQGHLRFAAALAVLSLVAFQFRLGNWSWAVICVVDLYLVLMLWCAACQSGLGLETWPGLPYREPAIFILLFVLLALVSGFGALYLNNVSNVTSKTDAAYASFVALATFSYSETMFRTPNAKLIATGQLASALLLLICAIPLLVSRLANFGGGLKVVTFNGCRIHLPDSEAAEVTIDGESFVWSREKDTITAKLASGKVTVTSTKVSAAACGSQLLIIESDGTYELWS